MENVQAIEISKAGGCAQGIACDVLNESQQASALEQHLQAYGTLEAVCLNAGIAETGKHTIQFLHRASAVATVLCCIKRTGSPAGRKNVPYQLQLQKQRGKRSSERTACRFMIRFLE